MMVPAPGMGAPAAPISTGSGVGTSAMSAGGEPRLLWWVVGFGRWATGGVGPERRNVGACQCCMQAATRVRVQRQRTDSPELSSAKALALKLRRDCDGAKYPCIEWAVGIFRSEAGGATECVVTSNEGFGYIPWGVFLPRSARLLGADQLADNGFRDDGLAAKIPPR